MCIFVTNLTRDLTGSHARAPQVFLGFVHAQIREIFDECLTHVLAEQGIAAQSVYEFEDMVADEHMKMRGNFIEWETKDGDTFKGLSPMPRFEQTPGQVWRPMPEQGGDTIDVLTKLGYTPEQIDELIAANVVKAG